MIKRCLSVICALVFCGFMPSSFAQPPQYQYPFQNPNLAPDKRIDNLLSLMTLDEKINCLRNCGVPRLDIPNTGSSEGIHGYVSHPNPERGRKAITTTQFPQPPGMGATWDPALVEKAGHVEGYEARFISQTPSYHRHSLVLWGPQVNLARDVRWGRLEEVYGEDPFFVGTMGVAFIHGLQGHNPKYIMTASLMKHFVGYSREDGRASAYVNFDQRNFWEYYSVPFRMGFLNGGAKGLMASYNAYDGKPMDINPILRSLVIDKWGGKLISTDGGAVHLMVQQFKIFPDQKAAVLACLKAGINQFLDTYKPEAKQLIEEGKFTEAGLDDLVRPKLQVSLELGLLDPPDMVPYSKIKDSPEPWDTPEHRAISKQMALESIVLLKNKKNFLPLKKDSLKSIAVIGPLADVVQWDWYGGTPPYKITPLDGIKTAVGPNVTVNYAKDNTDGAAVKAAKESDVALVFVGNVEPMCGKTKGVWLPNSSTPPCPYPSEGREGRDRSSITLEEESLVKQVHAANPKTVLVLVSSYPYAILWSQKHVPAILHMVDSSQDEGTALAEVIFGDYNPGGHLTQTWPASISQEPPMDDYNIRDGRTYMYFKGKPLYPFGYGLSYTTFRFSNIRTSAPSLTKDGAITVSVDVTNTGKRAGDAVAQLYVKHMKSAVQRPKEELEGFKRVSLAPGETKTVQIPLKASQLAYWDEKQNGFKVETEPVKLMIGDSSADLKVSTTIPVS